MRTTRSLVESVLSVQPENPAVRHFTLAGPHSQDGRPEWYRRWLFAVPHFFHLFLLLLLLDSSSTPSSFLNFLPRKHFYRIRKSLGQVLCLLAVVMGKLAPCMISLVDRLTNFFDWLLQVIAQCSIAKILWPQWGTDLRDTCSWRWSLPWSFNKRSSAFPCRTHPTHR